MLLFLFRFHGAVVAGAPTLAQIKTTTAVPINQVTYTVERLP